jgi:hypothetical protein
MASFERISVRTIALNDVFEEHFEGQPIEYMSVDTEGSELEILSAFDFNRYGPAVVTVEHNYTEAQPKIDALMSSSGYLRIFAPLTNFDAWYVRQDVAEQRGLA